MATLMSAWLLMVLTRALCEADQQLDRTTEDNVSPIIDLKLHPRKKTLTWNYTRDVTEHHCRIDTPLDPPMSMTPQVTAGPAYRCAFPNARLRRGATLTVRGSSQGHGFAEVLTFRNAGKDGSGAVGFACVLYDLRFMNCSWAPGPAAPADVQYHLYLWMSRCGGWGGKTRAAES
ncbi:interleukin-3 receptor subunit alpha-like [Sciurus carolinensis]|uniref:interleukin-3 receptor subunit alpha-like n=1 Tax=Sciurus carolinensis TaxID=30640 RepID=UPI001FB3ADDC|nr:interleukin-3 receptor subunit alpha-like [Sciurus carolinensis]